MMILNFTFKLKARKLVRILNQIVISLESYEKEDHSDYTTYLANCLKPLVTEFFDAVIISKSRNDAKQIFYSIKELMHGIGAAATKGEIDFIDHKVLDYYSELSNIFQESRNNKKQL